MSQPQTAEEDIKEFLQTDVRSWLKETKGKDTDLSTVVIWLEEYNSVNNVVTLGLAIGSATGCSPFCGCAAKDITEMIGDRLIKKLPWVRKVHGQAKVPSKQILDKWNS